MRTGGEKGKNTMKRPSKWNGTVRAACCAVLLGVLGSATARADDAVCANCYVGLRLANSLSSLDSDRATAELQQQQGSGVSANVHSHSIGGEVYAGYQFLPGVAVELGYLRLGSGSTTVNGTVANSPTPALNATASNISGYGNAALLALRYHFEVLPRLYIDPRAGFYVWRSSTDVEGADSSYSHSRVGLGENVGFGMSYRLWRGLEAGAGIDAYRSSANNQFRQISGQLEWRFGKL